jgi:hypothetical protein
MAEKRSTYRVLVGNPEEKGLLGRNKMKDNIKMDRKT